MTLLIPRFALALALFTTALGAAVAPAAWASAPWASTLWVTAAKDADSAVPAANPAPVATPAETLPNSGPDLLPGLPADSTEDQPVLAPFVVPDAAVETTNYSEQGMSIDFPVAWAVEEIENGVMIANVTTVETDLVATQVVRMAAPPGPVVDANIDSFIDEGSAVGRYQSVTVDDQDALVIWLSERPDQLTNAIATFIGYGDETILLFSRYAPTNETAEDSILRLHSSFSNLAAAGPSETVPEAAPETPELSEIPEPAE